jgi:hypothetical protein
LVEAAGILEKVAAAIESGEPCCSDLHVKMGGDSLLDALAGQLRSAAELAAHTTLAGRNSHGARRPSRGRCV